MFALVMEGGPNFGPRFHKSLEVLYGRIRKMIHGIQMPTIAYMQRVRRQHAAAGEAAEVSS